MTFRLILLVGILSASMVPAGSCRAQIHNITFDHLTVEDGLPSNIINAIVQDNTGFLWFGTENGLARYDGYKITNFKSEENDNSLVHNHITVLYKDSQGLLWIGTQGGVNQFDTTTEKFTQFLGGSKNPGILRGKAIRSILEDAYENIWIGTEEDGLFRYHRGEKKLIHYLHDPANKKSLRDTNLAALYFDKSAPDYLWIGGFFGLSRYDYEKDEFYYYGEQDPAFINQKVMDILGTDDGMLWLPTFGGGLFQYNRHSGLAKQYAFSESKLHGIGSNRIVSIHKDRLERLWLGSIDAGLDVFDMKSQLFYHFKQDRSNVSTLNSNTVSVIFEDRFGVIWLGTHGGGVSRYAIPSKPFNHFQPVIDEKNNVRLTGIRSLWEDGENDLWIGTEDEGLIHFNRDTKAIKQYKHDHLKENTLSNNSVFKVFCDSSGIFWLGTNGGGLNRYDPKTGTFKNYRREYPPDVPRSSKLSNNYIYDIFEDRDGFLWIATWGGANWGGGLDRFDPKTETFTHYSHIEGNNRTLNKNIVMHIIAGDEDYGDFLWVATRQGGLNRLDRKTNVFRYYTHEKGNSNTISHNDALALYDDGQGSLWIGTNGGGLNRLDLKTETFSHYRQVDGLPSDVINGIVPDERGNLWLSTDNGLSRFDIKAETFDNYTAFDGLQSDQFYHGSFYKTKKGEIMFGGPMGANIFYPDRIKNDTTVPMPVITDLRLLNQSVPLGRMEDGRIILTKALTETDEIKLSHRDNVISFEFAALHYTAPKRNKYAYMLEGFDREWNYTDSQKRFATYTNLNPGMYQFKVRVAKYNSVWNPESRVLRIRIPPPFWQTLWFKTLAVFMVIGSFFGIYGYRVRSIKLANRNLEEQVVARTSQLKRQKEQLEQALEELRKTRRHLLDSARKAGMADVATGILHNVGNILNSVNVTASVIRDTLKDSRISGIAKANELLRENMHRIDEFILNDPKGKKLLSYYLEIDELLKAENREMTNQVSRLREGIRSINEVIASQQRYAEGAVFTEVVELSEVVEEALALYSLLSSGSMRSLDIVKNMDRMIRVRIQRSKLTQIILNVLKNAEEATMEAGSSPPMLWINVLELDGTAILSFRDNGIGISESNLTSIFGQGFTTKPGGNGFGLHTCANYATEMGGRMWAESYGADKGATFKVSLPVSRLDSEV